MDPSKVNDACALRLVSKEGAVRVEVRAKPRANKSRLAGVRDGALEVMLAAPPVDGAANAELVATVARALGVAKSAVVLVRGASGRSKLVAVHGLDEADVRARIAAVLGGVAGEAAERGA